MSRRLELKYNREKKNLRQVDLAERVECNSVYYMQIETGRANPSVELAKKIAKEVDMDWTYFFK